MSEPSVQLDLSTPIKAHDETVRRLGFRAPTGADLVKAGFPFRYTQRGGEMQREIDTVSMAALIARLASIPPSSVDQMSAADWMEAMGVVIGFLGASPTSSTSISPSGISLAV